jgi:hypothetical protein
MIVKQNLNAPRFGALTTDQASMRDVLGPDAASQYAAAASQQQPGIDLFEKIGIHVKMEGVRGNDPKIDGATVCFRDSKILEADTELALVSLVDQGGNAICNKKFANMYLPPATFWERVIEEVRIYVTEVAALTEPVEPTPLGLKTYTPFPSLGHNAKKNTSWRGLQGKTRCSIRQTTGFEW